MRGLQVDVKPTGQQSFDDFGGDDARETDEYIVEGFHG